MTRRIDEDKKEFIDIVSGKIREHLKKFIKNGQFVSTRPNGDKYIINVPSIDLPTFRFGDNRSGKGGGQGNGKPGDTPGQTIPVAVSLDEILDIMKEELELPELIPKDNSQVFSEHIIYNGIKKTGPESLRHTRRTMRNTILRMIQTGEYDEEDPVLLPIQDDKRFRSWNIKRDPMCNAVIFFARDWSGSMGDEKCDIINNVCWWIDCWIRKFYNYTKTVYIGHDTEAQEVDQGRFYSERYGGGTKCSSAFSFIDDRITSSYPVDKWNSYIFYFSDGENYEEDNKLVVEKINKLSNNANLIGIGQIYAYYNDSSSLLNYIDTNIKKGAKNIKTFDYSRGDKSKDIEIIKKFLGK